jgi:pyruvate/2-oxoglutarate/acetoin dehydrogenase E1 component
MRASENLNAALAGVLDRDPRAYLLGEDITDPYGGAFKVTKGLSTRFPDRVRSTPISENAITGVAAGLALAGDTAIVEIMFGDFIALAFDQIVNFASKSVAMYGTRVPMRMVVRCPSGGGRGYGPTHSQSLMKHFVGVPHLALYEMSPFHDAAAVFAEMLDRGEPCVFFEDKVLYTRQMYEVPEPLRWTVEGGVAKIGWGGTPDCVVIAPGGVAHRAMAAMRSLMLEQEINCQLLVPSRLYPFDTGDVPDTGTVFVVEESTAGGTWGSEVAHRLHTERWTRLDRPVGLIHSGDAIIPTAGHLETEMLVSGAAIHRAIAQAFHV